MPTDILSPTKPYTVEAIPKHLHTEFRIADKDDNRVATCYVEENARLVADGLNAIAERDKLQAFKDWVHDWLTARGVPADPDPERTAATGCRISVRLDWLLANR